MKSFLTLFTILFTALTVCACATTSNDKKDLTPQEVAKYQEALDRAPDSIAPGTEFVVTATGDPQDIAAATAPSPEAVVVSRDLTVPAEAYDAFFSQSPAIVLGRVQLDPVRDGNTLLGWRIVKFTQGNFKGVDIQEEDIITRVDGKLPVTPDDYIAAWESMKNASTATVEIQRSVDHFTVTWTKQ